jgi:hypothetical protein
VVEVADSSLGEDRKGLARNAWVNIPVAWIVDLKSRAVEVYAQPTGPARPAKYQDVVVYGEGDEIPLVIDGRELGRIAVRDVLP